VLDAVGWSNGGANRDRTGDLLNAIQALSQLSYSPLHSGEALTMLRWGLSSFSQFFFGRSPYRLPSVGSIGNVQSFLTNDHHCGRR
jgi:hypothetical protein